VVDSARAGSTQLFDSGAFADLTKPAPAAAKPTGKTGGRLVCLTDGREYTIGEGSLTLGRDAGSDVVVSGQNVSRQHAEIRSDPEGYLLIDNSVNGTYVNGERISKTRRLSRADVIRIGTDEFRFYADAPPAKSPPRTPPDGLVTEAPAGAAQRLSDTMMGARVSELRRPTPTDPLASPLASLLIRSGEMKGRRLPIKVPVVNIGRGDYNDVVISDPSVSTMHAKLQRREALWILTDLGSTNGTFVDGQPVRRVSLRDGTRVTLGRTTLVFRRDGSY
jgi:pSer/pThr/pTyr-binding forkhead associated (FHA) protein